MKETHFQKRGRIALKLGYTAVLMAVVMFVCLPAVADELVRGLVVDRSDDILWLGLPDHVKKGAVFDVTLIPGSNVIARAEIIECTPDSPFVAKAKFVMEDPAAIIPVGAYVEATSDVVAKPGDLLSYEWATTRTEDQDRLSIQTGVFFPSERSVRDEVQNVWPAVQVSYRLSSDKSSTVGISAGYYGGTGTFTEGLVEGNRKLQVIPVSLDTKLKMGEKRQSGWFAKLGAGAYWVKDNRTVGTVKEEMNAVAFGWQAGIGWESKNGRSAQVYYTDVSKSDFKGFVFAVGVKF